MTAFKKGDRVRKFRAVNYQDNSLRESQIGWEGEVINHQSFDFGFGPRIDVKWDNGAETLSYEETLEIINGFKNKNMYEKFKISLMGEPKKTFVKTGIMDVEGNLTSDGRKIYEAWKFKKDEEAFNSEVATPLLAEQEKDNK